MTNSAKTKSDKTTLAAAKKIGKAFKIYCIKNDVDMVDALNVILQSAMKQPFKSFTK